MLCLKFSEYFLSNHVFKSILFGLVKVFQFLSLLPKSLIKIPLDGAGNPEARVKKKL